MNIFFVTDGNLARNRHWQEFFDRIIELDTLSLFHETGGDSPPFIKRVFQELGGRSFHP
jgi:hypothetical protein